MDIRVLMGLQERVGTAKSTDLVVAYATNFNVKADTNKIESKVLGIGRWVKDTIPGRRSVAGDFELQPSIAQVETVLEAAGFKKGSDSTYKASSFEKYLTLLSDFQSDNLSIEYKDCLVNTLGITVTQEDYVSVKVGVIGMGDDVKDNKVSSGSIKTVKDTQLVCYGAVLKQAESDISATVETVDININNSLEGKGGLNSRSFTKILQNGRGSIEVNIKFNAFDKDNYTTALKMLKENKGLKLELILKEDIADTEGANGRKLEITMPNVKLASVDLEDLEGAGGLSKVMTALPDENGEPITFKIVEPASGLGV